jgi:hypothetical protein
MGLLDIWLLLRSPPQNDHRDDALTSPRARLPPGQGKLLERAPKSLWSRDHGQAAPAVDAVSVPSWATPSAFGGATR